MPVVLFDFFPDIPAALVVAWQRAEGGLQLGVLIFKVAARDPGLVARSDGVNEVFGRAGYASKSNQLIAWNLHQIIFLHTASPMLHSAIGRALNLQPILQYLGEFQANLVGCTSNEFHSPFAGRGLIQS